MSWRNAAIDRSDDPGTVEGLARDLRGLGLRAGDVVLAHTSLSSLGWVCGGAVAVVEALLSVLAPGGTLVVPTHTSDRSDPAGWSNPPVPESWWPTIRATMPAFRPAVSPSRAMGAIPEVVRSWPGAWRSDHPRVSFAALGPDAAAVTGGHRLADGLGEGSPLARLYELDAAVLLLGVGHDRSTPCTWPSTGPASGRWSPSPDPSSGRSSACGSAGLTSTSTRSSSRRWEPTWSAPGW